MKSKILALAAAGLMLAGCSTVSTTVTDGSEKLMTIGNQTYTKENEYSLIKRIQGPALTLQTAQRAIYDEEIGTGEEVQKAANEMYDKYASSTEDFEKSLKEYGYEDKADYMANVIIPSVQAQKLLEKYMSEAKEDIKATYKPTLAAVIATSSKDNADKALEALKNGEQPSVVGSQYAVEGSSYTGTEQIVSTLSSDLPTRLVNSLNEASEPGIIDEVFETDTSTDNKTYYVAKLVSQDYDKILEAITTALGSDKDLNSNCVVFYLTKYKFEVHDQYIFDYFKANYPQYLVTRPDLTESASTSTTSK